MIFAAGIFYLFALADKTQLVEAQAVCEAVLGKKCIYVSTSGNNTSGTGTFSLPYKTIKKAISAMTSGDIIYLRAGTYVEYQINIPASKNGTASAYSTIKSYPGEWAIVNGQHGGTGQQRSIFYGTENPMQYWAFENMEITGGGSSSSPPDAGAGIFLTNAKHNKFRNLYIHDNYASTVNVGATGGILLNDDAIAPSDNIVEYNYFKCNGNPNADHNSANGNIAIFSDYKYEAVVNPANAQHNNIIRYNLFSGQCASGYTDVAIMQKGMQRLTGYVYGEAGNSADALPNNAGYRSYGDQYHHNIIINHRMGVRLDQDYVQFFKNIVWLSGGSWTAEETAAVELRDGYTERRGPYYGCVYNNTVFADSKRGIIFHLIADGWNCSTNGKSCTIDYGYAVNNILDTANTGYDWTPLSFDSHGVSNCTAPQPLDPATLISSRNYFYRTVANTGSNANDKVYIQDKYYTQAEIEATASADNVFVNPYNASDLLYQGTSGVNQYKTRASHILEGSYTIANGGIGGSHPYLNGVTIPSYVGATNPNDNVWVDGVLSLANVSTLTSATSADPTWIEGGSGTPPPPPPPTYLLIDFNKDKEINSADFDHLKQEWAKAVSDADVNQDSLVDARDFGIIMSKWGKY